MEVFKEDNEYREDEEYNEYNEDKEDEEDWEDGEEKGSKGEEGPGAKVQGPKGEEELSNDQFLEFGNIDQIYREPNAWEVFEKAIELQGKKKYREARDMLSDMLEDDDLEIPEHLQTQGLSLLARLEYWLGNFSSAERIAAQVIKGAPDCCKELAYEILARISIDRFEFQLAEQYEAQLLPSSTTRALIRCFINLRKGNTKGAEATLNALSTVIDSDDPEYLLYRSMLDVLQGEPRSALAGARQLADSDGLNPSFTLLLAEIFVEAGSTAEASSVLRGLEGVSPRHPAMAVVKAQIAFHKEYYGETENHVREALQLNPSHQKMRALLVRLQVQSGNDAVAERTAHQMVSESPDYPESQAALADVYYAQGRFTEARQAYEDSFLWSSRDSVQGRFRQARIAIIDEEYDRAIRFLEELKEKPLYQKEVQEDLELCYASLEDDQKREEVGQEFRLRLFFANRQGELLELVMS